jgi:hypothetical protein
MMSGLISELREGEVRWPGYGQSTRGRKASDPPGGYTKLFGSIVGSTIWEEDHATRIVWITLLALSDAAGNVTASVPGLARLAHVTLEECELALHKFQQPYKYSRSKAYEGRRIEIVDGGFFILNRVSIAMLLGKKARPPVIASKTVRATTGRRIGSIRIIRINRMSENPGHCAKLSRENKERPRVDFPVSIASALHLE